MRAERKTMAEWGFIHSMECSGSSCFAKHVMREPNKHWLHFNTRESPRLKAKARKSTNHRMRTARPAPGPRAPARSRAVCASEGWNGMYR